MTWTDEFATAVRELYRGANPAMAPNSEGLELSLGRPAFWGEEMAPVKVLIEQVWIERAIHFGGTPKAAASVLVDNIVEVLSKPPGEGPVGLVLLEGRPPKQRPRHVSCPMYFDIPRPDSSSGESDPEEPSRDNNSG